MSHFARLNANKITVEGLGEVHEVVHVHVVHEDDEERGIYFLENLHRIPNVIFKKTSYNDRIRFNYASLGGYYCPIRDAFISKRVYLSWILNEEICRWEAPVKYPVDGNNYKWNEELLTWEN